jgi:4-diphosphocytidyl-2-C-methyl-D-erythritol kinase
MSQDHAILLHCPAKVNLALSVGAPQPNGMHPIASLMCSLTFGDELKLEKAKARSSFDIQFVKLSEDDDQAMGIVDWPLEKDLAYRALLAVETHVGHKLPIMATIRKRIPAGAGLAGGSGNAAGILVGLNRLYDLNLSTDTLTQLARLLGSDVVFVVHAMQQQLSAAIVSGFGENITPMNLVQVVHMVLIFPPFGCPTGPVYGAFDQLLQNPAKQADLPMVEQLAIKSVIEQHDPFNDLAQAACDVQPDLGTLQQQLADSLQLPVHITGSGSTMYLICPNSHTAQASARRIRAEFGLKTIATRTM